MLWKKFGILFAAILVLSGSTNVGQAAETDESKSADQNQNAGKQNTPEKKPPNILVIMGDDVGWFNIGAYNQGIMSGKTPTQTSWLPKG